MKKILDKLRQLPYVFWMRGTRFEKRIRVGRVLRNNNPVKRKEGLSLNLTKSELQQVVTSAVNAAMKLTRGNSCSTRRSSMQGDRGQNIRSAIRSGRTKSVVRRQFRLSDYEYRGPKATVTRESNGY